MAAAPTPAAPQSRPPDEQNAMEAVRELLFGKRVAEFHAQMESVEQRLNSAVQRVENYAQLRLADLERLISESERRLAQALAAEQAERQHESTQAKKMFDDRFMLVHRNMETFALETAKHLEARRSELHAVKQEFAAETRHLRDHTPTVHALADLFQHSSERLRSSLPGATAPQSDPAPQRSAALQETGVLDGLPG